MAARETWDDEELRRELRGEPLSPGHPLNTNDRVSQDSAPPPPGSRHPSEPISPEPALRLLVEQDDLAASSPRDSLEEAKWRTSGAMHRRDSEDADEPRTGDAQSTPQSVFYAPGEYGSAESPLAEVGTRAPAAAVAEAGTGARGLRVDAAGPESVSRPIGALRPTPPAASERERGSAGRQRPVPRLLKEGGEVCTERIPPSAIHLRGRTVSPAGRAARLCTIRPPH